MNEFFWVKWKKAFYEAVLIKAKTPYPNTGDQMKQRIAKLGNKTKMIAGGIFLAVLMAVNVQVGTHKYGFSEINLNILESGIFIPVATATIECENDQCAKATDPDGKSVPICIDYSNVPGGQSGFNCDAGTDDCEQKKC